MFTWEDQVNGVIRTAIEEIRSPNSVWALWLKQYFPTNNTCENRLLLASYMNFETRHLGVGAAQALAMQMSSYDLQMRR